MFQIWQTSAILIVALAGGGGTEFKEFSSPEGKFKVQLPGTPAKKSQNVAGMSLYMFTVEEKNGAYMVAYSDSAIPIGNTKEEIKMRLDDARDGMVTNVKAKFTGERDLTLQGKYSGREVMAELPDNNGFIRARVYIVNQRLFQVMVVGTKAWVESADAAKVLNSLTVQE